MSEEQLSEENKQSSSDEDARLNAMSKAMDDDLHRELDLEELADILNLTIKKDQENKVITFLVMLGTYTDEEQSNLMFKSGSSEGKSHIALETAEHFPSDDVIKIGYASPTSFFHEYGKRKETKKTSKVEGDKVVEEKHVYYEINMSKRIYICKDAQSMALLERLRSMLSHDERELQIQFTNKMEKSGYRTQHIRVMGYPTFIFCTASGRVIDEQEATRFFQLSPETETGKIEEGIRLLGLKKGNKPRYTNMISTDVKRIWLQQRIKDIKAENIFDVVIAKESKVADDFIQSKKHLQPRHMRDFGRLLSLIKYWAILNNWTRKKDVTDKGVIVYANEIDVEVGFILYGAICESNEIGLSPELYKIYQDIFEKPEVTNGLNKEQIYARYLNTYFRPLGSRKLEKEIIPSLEAVGLIYSVEGTGVGGKPKVYRCTKYMEKSATEGGKVMDGQVTLPFSPPKTNGDKLVIVLDAIPDRSFPPMNLQQIEELVVGKGIVQSEVFKLLEILEKDGKVFHPNGDYTYSKV